MRKPPPEWRFLQPNIKDFSERLWGNAQLQEHICVISCAVLRLDREKSDAVCHPHETLSDQLLDPGLLLRWSHCLSLMIFSSLLLFVASSVLFFLRFFHRLVLLCLRLFSSSCLTLISPFTLLYCLFSFPFGRCLSDSIFFPIPFLSSLLHVPLFFLFPPRVTLDPSKRQSSNKSVSGCTLPQGTKTVSKSSFPMFSGCICLPVCLPVCPSPPPPHPSIHQLSAAGWSLNLYLKQSCSAEEFILIHTSPERETAPFFTISEDDDLCG